MKHPTLLLDSHMLIWGAFEPQRLKGHAYAMILDAETIMVSQISLIELSFKHAKGKLRYAPADLYEAVESLRASILPIEQNHLSLLASIQLAHKDPFDRLLIAQAQSENLPLLTADQTLLDSPYPTIDART